MTGETSAAIGRRPGKPQTRELVLGVAREQFATKGFTATSLRAIATKAGVDVALIGHYFGSKAGLFAACVQWPLDPGQAIRRVVDGPSDSAVDRLAQTFVEQWRAAGWRSPLIALVAVATTDKTVAALLRDFLVNQLIAPILAELGVDRPTLRAGLMSSCLFGLGLGRHTLGLISPEEVDDATLSGVVARVLHSIVNSDLPDTGYEHGGTTRPSRKRE